MRSVARRIVLAFVVLPLAVGILVAAGVGAGGLAVHALQPTEIGADRRMAAHRSAAITTVMLAFTAIAGEQAVIVLVAIAVVVLLIARQVADAVGVALSAAGMLSMYELVVRLVGRHRPPVVRIDDPGGSSFPSGHVANSTALYVAVLIALFLVTRRPGLMALGASVAALTAVAPRRPSERARTAPRWLDCWRSTAARRKPAGDPDRRRDRTVVYGRRHTHCRIHGSYRRLAREPGLRAHPREHPSRAAAVAGRDREQGPGPCPTLGRLSISRLSPLAPGSP